MSGDTDVALSARPKLRRCAQGAVGFAGSVADGQWLCDYLAEHLASDPETALRRARAARGTDLDASCVYATTGRLWHLGGDGCAVPVRGAVAAVGSGGAAALGALRALTRHTELTPEQAVREALRVAAQDTLDVRGPFDVWSEHFPQRKGRK